MIDRVFWYLKEIGYPPDPTLGDNPFRPDFRPTGDHRPRLANGQVERNGRGGAEAAATATPRITAHNRA